MDATNRLQAPDPALESPLTAAAHAQAIRLYLKRLARLLAPDLPGGAELSGRERRRLRCRAVLATVLALTDLGAGWAASELLRRAGAPCVPPAR